MDLIEKTAFKGNRHPWELSRRDSLLMLLKKKPFGLQYADIGSGDLFFSLSLEGYADKIWAFDKAYAQEDKNGKIKKINSLSSIPQESVDVVLALDVLEHVEDEAGFLYSLNRIIKPGAEFIITVPAYQFLFTGHDKFLKHLRRYNYQKLSGLIQVSGLKVEEGFYFYSTLVLPRAIIKLKEKFFGVSCQCGASGWRFGRGHALTFLFRGLLNFDFYLNRILSKAGIKLPGLSICMVCKK
ncbi:MAG: methyltransferase domain-containing protein [Candidatus Omnitrophica bacterium]|jgi:SAM-dependent methyltransferase|nr:methyltransferase domain-containing protein [Candidatus Omnitrophota bacterium]